MADQLLDLRAGLALVGITVQELWLDCAAIGGAISSAHLAAALSGAAAIAPDDRLVVEQALNEGLLDLGLAALFVRDNSGPTEGAGHAPRNRGVPSE